MQTLLQLFNAAHVGNFKDIRPLVTIARNNLRRVREHPVETPPADSPAMAAFDPHVTRRLHTVMPTRELELPSQDVIWNDIERTLDDWDNVDHLRENHTLLAWQVRPEFGPILYCAKRTYRSTARLVLGYQADPYQYHTFVP